MSNLAVNAAFSGSGSLREHRFKRVLRRVEDRVGEGRNVQRLSLSSAGHLYKREGATDRQQASGATEERSLCVGPGQLVVNPMWLTGGSIAVSDAEGAVSPDYRVFEADKKQLDARYLHHLLRSQPYRDQYNLFVRANTTFDRRIQQEDLDQLPLWLPDVEVQRRIADFLDDRVARIDQIITARKAQIAATEGRFEARRRNAVLGLSTETHATDLAWAAQVGVGWRVRRLSQVARMGTGHTPSRSEPDYWIDCDIPWLTTSDVHRFRRDEIDRIDDTEIQISKAGLANSAAVLHRAGTVALSRTASAGFSIVMNTDMATSQDFVTWSCSQELRPDYLLHTLRVMRPYLLGYLAMGSTHKTIYFPDLMDIRVPLPSLAQQDQVIGQVRVAADERASLSTAMERQIELLLEYKQSLITAAVTGEIDVTTAGSGIQG